MPFLWFEKKDIGHGTRCLPLSIGAVESATWFFMSLTLLATALILSFVAKEALESFREVGS